MDQRQQFYAKAAAVGVSRQTAEQLLDRALGADGQRIGGDPFDLAEQYLKLVARPQQAVALEAFLKARLAEDEAVAREASPDRASHWQRGGDPKAPLDVIDSRGQRVVYYEGRPLSGQATHIARHDPARVLAEVDAKRRVLVRYEEERAIQTSGMGGLLTKYLVPRYEEIIRLLALPYADHPDYRPEWAPDA
nr:hypothetical protein KPHV_60670 [Kitasatospora purpeofusca]